VVGRIQSDATSSCPYALQVEPSRGMGAWNCRRKRIRLIVFEARKVVGITRAPNSDEHSTNCFAIATRCKVFEDAGDDKIKTTLCL
jgi:hypothetical protein